MRAVTLVLAGLSLLGLASSSSRNVEHTPDDKEFLIRQKKLYQLLWHVYEPLLYPELKELAESFQLEKNERYFENPEVVQTFLKYYRQGHFQTRGERFSAYTESGGLQLQALVSLLFNAKDFDIFFKTATWARQYLNADLFVTAIYVTSILRRDSNGVIFPAQYEILPWRYFNTAVITDAWRAALEGKTYNKKRPYVIPVNYNSSCTPSADNLMTYYFEDVSFLTLRDMFRLRYPYWIKLEDYHQPNDTRRGDYFYYICKIFHGRYYLERLSHHLPDIEPIDYEEPICGVEAYSQLVENIKAAERRLRDAADKGYIYDNKWRKYSLHEPGGSDIFGRLVQGNADSVNIQYYRTFYNDLLAYAQQYINCCNEYTVGQCGLDRPDSIFASPVYFRMLRRIVLTLDYFKGTLEPYSHKELWLPGVKVENLTFDKVVTFFEYFYIDLNNAVPVANIDIAHKLGVVAQTQRLNRKPFSYHVDVHSDKDIEVVVRVWVGPSHDVYGRELSLNEKRLYMYPIDTFAYKLQKGKNELVRHSKDLMGDKVPLEFQTLIHTTEAALDRKTPPFRDSFFQDVAFNNHLNLPRGYRSGMKITTFVMITPYEPHSSIYPSPGTTSISYLPFDRPMDEHGFHVPNACFGEAHVFHWEANEKSAA